MCIDGAGPARAAPGAALLLPELLCPYQPGYGLEVGGWGVSYERGTPVLCSKSLGSRLRGYQSGVAGYGIEVEGLGPPGAAPGAALLLPELLRPYQPGYEPFVHINQVTSPCISTKMRTRG